MKIDMAVKEPRARVVGRETNRDVVPCGAGADSVALRRVHVVVVAAPRAADDVEGVLRGQILAMKSESLETAVTLRAWVHLLRANGRDGEFQGHWSP